MKNNLFLTSRFGLTLMSATAVTCSAGFYFTSGQHKNLNISSGRSYAALSLLNKPSCDITQFPVDFKDDLGNLKFRRKRKTEDSPSSESGLPTSKPKDNRKQSKGKGSKNGKKKKNTRKRENLTSDVTQLRRSGEKSSQILEQSPINAKFSSSPTS